MTDQIGFGRGRTKDIPQTWRTGFFTYTEDIVPGIVFRYNCTYVRGDVTNTAAEIQSTVQLDQSEVETRFAVFTASFA
jgi:hypothetical protein